MQLRCFGAHPRMCLTRPSLALSHAIFETCPPRNSRLGGDREQEQANSGKSIPWRGSAVPLARMRFASTLELEREVFASCFESGVE